MGRDFLEEDMYAPVKELLINQGYEVRSEVSHCDVTAIKEDQLVIVELKRNLSVELLTQAVKRQKFSDLVYIAVPKPKKFTISAKWKDILHLLRRLELGLLLVTLRGEVSYVEVVLDPRPFDRQKSIQNNKKLRKKAIAEIGGRHSDLNTGGSRGRKLVTAYMEASLYIACCMDMQGPLSAKMLKDYGVENKRASSILIKNHYGWFDRIDKGIYTLNDTGRKNLEDYPELAALYRKQIGERLEAAEQLQG